MYQFEVSRPATAEEACRLLAQAPEERCVLAGGTDLMVQVHEKDSRWENLKMVIDITGIPGLNEISVKDGIVTVGALVTHTQAEQSDVLKEHAAVLADACRSVGGPQIRNTGTLGGAIGNASPASDPMPVLLALGATVLIAGVDGKREVPMDGFVTKPGKTGLAPGEIITGFSFPSAKDKKGVFVKLGRRKALSISRMNITVLASQDADVTITDISLVPGCVFAKPEHAEKAEKALISAVPTAELIESAAVLVADEMIEKTGVRWSTEYKQPVVTTLVRRALTEALEVK